MKLTRWLILAGILLALLSIAWFYWQAPEKSDMARFVPAETLVYLEANDLPAILKAYTSTEAWRDLAPQYGISTNLGEFGWLSRFLANANLGSANNAIFGRSQIAVALLGFATSEAGETLKIKPRYALVIDTKTSNSRARGLVEKEVGDFARKQFGDVRVEKSERENVHWTILHSQKDERKIFAAVAESLVILGNDEAAVQSCLDVRSGKRKSLQDNERLREMRSRTEADSSLAFGFVSPEGVKTLAEVAAVFLAGQISEEPAAMSLVAQSLPPLAEKSVAAIGWTARAAEGKIEDRYYVALPPDLVTRLREPLAVAGEQKTAAARFLPAEVNTVTVYNLKNHGAAWRGMLLAFASRLDAVAAAAFAGASRNLLQPYGVAQPNDFLSASGNEIVTARLSAEENETVAFVKAGDAGKMQAALEKTEKDLNRGAAVVNDVLLLGEKDDVERCLKADASGENLANTEIWRSFLESKFSLNAPVLKTLARDKDSAPGFIRIFADKRTPAAAPEKNDASWTFYISETYLRDGGFERRTRSAFGLIGWLAANFAGGEE